MLKSVVLATLLGACSVLGAECSRDKQCPEETPCCSQYGECGIGAFCLGGCDPTASYSLDACVPAPVCESKELDFKSLKRVADIGEYLGDPTDYDWVASGEPAQHDGNVLLTMPKGSVGTVMSSTTYLWYGNVKARMKSSRGRGVVTAFILFSDVKDEIDYEWIGVDLETAQTNYYFQGITNYTNSENITLENSFSDFHDYEFRWTPDKIEWLVDGKVGRTVEREGTWNATAQLWEYPQTPSRVQLSLWPGGAEGNPEGTVNWAGGTIDWNHEDIKRLGYFYVEVESVSIECYDGKDGLGTNDNKSYWYDSEVGTNNTIVDGDRDTVLASMQATGLNMEKGKKKTDNKDDDDDDDKDDDDKEEPKTVPGGTTGSTGNDHSDEGESSGGGAGTSGDAGGTQPTEEYDWSNFDQGLSSNDDAGQSSSTDGGNAGTKAQASLLAIVVAGCALYWR
ncbi:cell wall glucanase (Utr2) [Emericellopsis cladophorae]|uniref:Crh-like protein n=1 Tax=Emericellopsis cladophorae TaxID=2686198 RepID=A0A9Q0BDE6_9HYPO|nr:cell wall glucanase (Utr2) [Emericellopsis cladophorae]KAI6780094.1 cell wall glucanase (Utr2) [Emericellopsis cladophorae]